MRTVTETRSTTVDGKKTVTTTTSTYLKIGDIIGTAKNAYDLGNRLRSKKGAITKILKNYGASYVASLLNPLIVLIKGMEIYKKILAVVEIVTPIAQTVARASGVWSSPGNVGDIASILLGVVNKILIQLATIFLIKMKDIIWNFEFKIKSTTEQATTIISQAVYNINNKSYEIVNKKTTSEKYETGTPKNPANPGSKIPDNSNNIDGCGEGDENIIYKYSRFNEGIEYKEKIDGVWDTNWKKSNYADGSFRIVVKKFNMLFAFSYEGEKMDSKPYGIIYSTDGGKYWTPINAFTNYYVYDAEFLGNNLNFSSYDAVAKNTGIKKIVLTDRGTETLKEYELIDVLKDYLTDWKIYFRKYNNGDKDVLEYYYDFEMTGKDLHAVKDDITTNDLIIRANKFAIIPIVKNSDESFSLEDFIDAKDQEGNIKFDTSENYISSYGVSNLIFDTMFAEDVEINTEVSKMTVELI